MGREYNKRAASRRSGRAPQFLVITVTFLLGYLTATVFDIETITHWITTQVLASHESDKPHPSAQAQQEQKTIPPKPKFEFYTLLTHEKSSNSHVATASPATQTAMTTAAVSAVKSNMANQPGSEKAAELALSGKGGFSVQVASFKLRQDAESMKGSLILKGFNVSIIPISHVSKGNWFRVMVGPYTNRLAAQRAQVDLARNEHLNGMITAG